MKNQEIFVTKPSLPPLSEFLPYLQKIWDTRLLTNQGPFHEQLEKELCIYLGVKAISLFANGTVALVAALQALRLTGEVITTPFSFVATAHSISLSGLKPVFVDIEPNTLNLDPSQVEAAITDKTTAIMPVHCYGHPCDVEAIQLIADKYGLKVIYDAAHAFDVECHCGSVLTHGDLSVLSFHATKVFNTFEGGAIVCEDLEIKKQIDQIKNFGIVNELEIPAVGFNGKMSELNAALGLLQLKHLKNWVEQRKTIDQCYRAKLAGVPGIRVIKIAEQKANYAYFPILVSADYPITRDALYKKFKDAGIHVRRYFYPLISNLPPYQKIQSAKKLELPNANSASEQVLCLPIYPDLQINEVERIVALIRSQ
jgi:dTDP-4-amino-4,6-dideoxygalactose transaminase